MRARQGIHICKITCAQLRIVMLEATLCKHSKLIITCKYSGWGKGRHTIFSRTLVISPCAGRLPSRESCGSRLLAYVEIHRCSWRRAITSSTRQIPLPDSMTPFPRVPTLHRVRNKCLGRRGEVIFSISNSLPTPSHGKAWEGGPYFLLNPSAALCIL